MAKLTGKIAIVTGGGTGIGRSTALMLAAEGALVVVSGRRKGPLEAVVAEIKKAGGKAIAREGDVSRPEHGRALVERRAMSAGSGKRSGRPSSTSTSPACTR
jgi:NAD(P)-dependent dehydrogenase (short-subunit alcohol dehydrogenase family)